ncbi:hypothetical protein SMCF_5105, partial [Streptomyces coelicoflavus ZG0656]
MTGSTPSPSRRNRRRTVGAVAVLAAAAVTA